MSRKIINLLSQIRRNVKYVISERKIINLLGRIRRNVKYDSSKDYSMEDSEKIRKRAKSYWSKTFFHPTHYVDTKIVLSMNGKKLLKKMQEIIDYRERLYNYSQNMAWSLLNGNILDFGCGSCPDGHFFLKNNLIDHLTYADIIPSNISVASKHLSLISEQITAFLWDKPEDLDRLGKFDIIYSNGVLHHILDAKEIVDKLKQRLKYPDGFFLIMLYTYKLHPKGTKSYREGPFSRGYDIDDVKELFGNDMKVSDVNLFYEGKFCRYIVRWK